MGKKANNKERVHLFNKLKEIIRAEIPNALSKKFFGQMFLGVVMIFIGVSIIPFTWSFSYSALPIIIGIALIISGLLYKGSILIDGYTVIEGVILERTKILPGRNVADAYIIQTDDGINVHVPNDKRKHPFPVGAEVIVFISKRSAPYSRDEYTVYYGDILGYEPIMSRKARSEKKNREDAKERQRNFSNSEDIDSLS